MQDYRRGSQWRRWDLHVHTPETKKNDMFFGRTSEDKWNAFYSDIEKYIGDGTDPVKAIAAIGITDYLSIDNYIKVKADKKLPKCIDLLLPNIEMRISVTAHDSPVNIHFIFDPAFDNYIESRFLANLKFSYPNNGCFNATKSELIRLGKAYDVSLGESAAYKKGIELFLPSLDSIKEIFDSNRDMRNHVVVVVPNGSNDGIGGIDNGNGQMHGVKRSILHFADAIFSGNPSDRDFYLGKKAGCSIEILKIECGGVKACIHGCDAHENSKLFEPDQQRYCWIKADPTFNGLKQIIYEPEERVRITTTKPDVKPSYQVIESITIDHPDFQKEPILLNDKLNCIIGGKSTGKSILLHNLARAISLKQVEEKCKITSIKGKGDTKGKSMTLELPLEKLLVNWLDGDISPERKIVYIPQTYLNRLADSSEDSTEIDDIVERILLELLDSDGIPLQKAKNDLLVKIDTLKSEITSTLLEIIRKNDMIQKSNEEIENLGGRKFVENEISKLYKQRNVQSQTLSINEENMRMYDNAISTINNLTELVEQYDKEILEISNTNIVIKSIDAFAELSEETYKEITTIVDTLVSIANDEWNSKKAEIIIRIKEKKNATQIAIDESLCVRDSLKSTIESNNLVKELAEKISIESEKLQRINKTEGILTGLRIEFTSLLETISSKLTCILSEYRKFADTINKYTQNDDMELSYSVQIPFRREDFISKWNEIYGVRSTKSRDMINADKFAVNDFNSSFIKSIIMKTLSEELVPLKGMNKEQALRGILDDWYNVKYIVEMSGDTIDIMSPGKKALVLLKLLIELADSDCPILIDQPEDDLDNRSIYDSLIDFIRSKKIMRQIIVVTHNANIVLGADADEVIVANQDGIDSTMKAYRFEYRSGSIENNCPIYKNGKVDDGILNSRGIQQHICDILEGGVMAFEKRKNKYHI